MAGASCHLASVAHVGSSMYCAAIVMASINRRFWPCSVRVSAGIEPATAHVMARWISLLCSGVLTSFVLADVSGCSATHDTSSSSAAPAPAVPSGGETLGGSALDGGWECGIPRSPTSPATTQPDSGCRELSLEDYCASSPAACPRVDDLSAVCEKIGVHWAEAYEVPACDQIVLSTSTSLGRKVYVFRKSTGKLIAIDSWTDTSSGCVVEDGGTPACRGEVGACLVVCGYWFETGPGVIQGKPEHCAPKDGGAPDGG